MYFLLDVRFTRCTYCLLSVLLTFVGVIDSENQAKIKQEKTIDSTCNDMLDWLKSASQELQTPLTLSAKDDVLKQQIRQHEVCIRDHCKITIYKRSL